MGAVREFCESSNNPAGLSMKSSTNVLILRFKTLSGIIKNNFKMRWSAVNAGKFMNS